MRTVNSLPADFASNLVLALVPLPADFFLLCLLICFLEIDRVHRLAVCILPKLGHFHASTVGTSHWHCGFIFMYCLLANGRPGYDDGIGELHPLLFLGEDDARYKAIQVLG